jgi:hypothetical protein
MRLLSVLAGIAILAAACGGGGGTNTASTAQIREIRDKLASTSLGCQNYQELRPDQGAVAGASCLVLNVRASIISSDSQSDVSLIIGRYCAVTGAHWAVISAESLPATEIAAAIGGDAKVVNC